MAQQSNGRSFHSRTQKQQKSPNPEEIADQEEEEDPYDVRIKNSGCAQFHYALQVKIKYVRKRNYLWQSTIINDGLACYWQLFKIKD